MKVIKNLTNLQPCVASIGNFDGIHCGHQNILQQIVAQAKQRNILSTVIIFEPQAQEFFLRKNAPTRLTNLAEKLFYFEQFNIDQVVVLEFNEALKNLLADDFIQQILMDKVNVQHLIVGDDFKFGADRKGDFALLQANQKFSVANTETILIDGARVSSSRVRDALANNQFDSAKKLLARAYSMRGAVVHGDQKGRQIGVPTANIKPERLVLPLSGVFAVRVQGLDKEYFGVANLGTRPTVDDLKTLLETHIFNFNGDIYGKIIEIEFCHKIRDEQKFASFDELKQQIQKDLATAKNYFQ